MRVLVIGSTGCIGSAVANALRMRGHNVIAAARSLDDGERSMHVDYMQPRTPEAWAQRLRDARIDAVVNAVGILIPSRTQRFERVHAQGPIELFRGAALAGVRRIVQVSALGVDASALDVPYLATKLAADDALQAVASQHAIDHAVVRPSLVYGPGSDSGALFATLASLPMIGLPGRGRQPVQPIHVYEVAEAITRLLEQPGPLAGVFELAGPRATTYREMLDAYRRALGMGDAIWLPVPMPLMKLGAWFAEALPQRVFARDTMRLLERGNVATANATPALLKRDPTGLSEGLRVTPPQPMVELRVDLSPAVSMGLRAAVAFLWLYTALITALRPQGSGVLDLLARCGFEGDAGMAMMVASCALNVAMGLAILARSPGAWTYAVQVGAVIGYTATAAVAMPELTLDHCGPLAKNVPLLALLVMLWCARAPVRGPAAAPTRATSAARARVRPARRAERTPPMSLPIRMPRTGAAHQETAT
jgi:nucleoside-diphosphate-sugar epimerase